MLIQLDLALITKAVGPMVAGAVVGLVEENREDIKLPGIITYRQQVQQLARLLKRVGGK